MSYLKNVNIIFVLLAGVYCRASDGREREIIRFLIGRLTFSWEKQPPYVSAARSFLLSSTQDPLPQWGRTLSISSSSFQKGNITILPSSYWNLIVRLSTSMSASMTSSRRRATSKRDLSFSSRRVATNSASTLTFEMSLFFLSIVSNNFLFSSSSCLENLSHVSSTDRHSL